MIRSRKMLKRVGDRPVDNKYSYTDRDIAETLNSFFTSVSKINDENVILPNFIAKTVSILHSVNVTSDQIEALIKSLNLNKASGPDLINHKMLKGAAKAVSKPLTILFNRSLGESILPDSWKIANVIPIFKIGLASDPPIIDRYLYCVLQVNFWSNWSSKTSIIIYMTIISCINISQDLYLTTRLLFSL